MTASTKPDARSGAPDGARVLVVDDDDSILSLIREVLEDDGYNVTTASSGEEALALLDGEPFALVMSDIRLPGMDGIAVLEHVKNVSPRSNVIMITSHASFQSSVDAMKLGAYDYLTKPFEEISLISSAAKRAVDAYNLEVERSQLIRSLKLSNEELEHMNQVFRDLAIRDGLTQLFNHRHINEVLDSEINRTLLDDGDLSLIFLDVDQFKAYNDTYGHHSGDELLRELSALMRETVRAKDSLSRWGGEEFLVVCPTTNEEAASRLAEELRTTIEGHVFHTNAAQAGTKITISAGVSALGRYRTKTALLEAADNALYQAKRRGRNRICVASRLG